MKKRKILSLLLSLCLLISLLPTVALAADQKENAAGVRITEESYNSTESILTVNVQIKMPDNSGINTVGSLISYDSSKLTLMHKKNNTDYSATTVTPPPSCTDAVKILLQTKETQELGGVDYPYSYNVPSAYLYGKDNRAGLFVGLGCPPGMTAKDDQKTTDWLTIYQLRFKVSGDPSVVLNSDSLRIADPAKDNDVIKGSYVANDQYTVSVNSHGSKWFKYGKMTGNTEPDLTGDHWAIPAENVTATYPGSTPVTPPAPATLTGISVKTEPTKMTYNEGESFDATGMVIEATYSDTSKKDITTYTYAPTVALTTSDTEVTISYTEGGVTKTCTQDIVVNAAAKTLSSIAVTTAPTKTIYTEGENFNPAGMVVTATYSDTSTAAVTSYTVTDGNSLTAGKTTVTISYTEGSETKTCTQDIVVNAAAKTLSSIAVTTAPTKTTYTAGEDFDPAGMVVTATYNDSSTAAVTSYTVTDGNNLTAGKTSVTISYTEGGVTKTCTQPITVNAVTPPAPTEYTITFNGNGGTPSAGTMSTAGGKLTSLPTATRSGSYSFDGWYTAASGGTQITTAYVFSANTTVYAHWTYTGGGGSYYAPVVPDMPMLYSGCTGDAVKTLQEKLNAKGFDSGNVDGIFGAKTYAAVTAFQKANSLGVDGIVGKLTWAKLYDATPVNVTPVTTQPMLRTGSRGDAVRKLQELLNAKGYTCGSVDGIFGSKTYAAVLAFQKANGLAADGIVGPLTWGKLV